MITLRYQLKPEDWDSPYFRFAPRLFMALSHLFLLFVYLIVYLGSSYIFGGSAYFYDRLYTVQGMWFIILLAFGLTYLGGNGDNTDKRLQSEYVVAISPETIDIASEYRSVRMRLSAFQKYRVYNDAIVLYDSWGPFHIFPRRYFPSKEDYQTFLSYLEANLCKPQT
jgi:YcxB-like protein